jgi:hypothetical protein
VPNASEHRIQHDILVALGRRPELRLWRQNTGAVKVEDRFIRFGVKGCADILGLIAPTGRLLAIEVKGPHGKLSPAQEAFGVMVRRFGGLYVVARSVEDAVTAVEAALNGGPR